MKQIFLIVLFIAMMLAACGGEKRPSILLIVIDTLAAEHMSCYGYHRETTPYIDSLASTGERWVHMQAQAPWTLPSMASILTGLTVRSHGCGYYEDIQASRGLDPELPTLATIFLEEGYRTAAFVNITYLGETYGMNKDFQHFCYDGNGHGRARITVDSLFAWLDSDDFQEPFFVFFHLFDPHAPYDPPEGYDRSFEPNGTMGITDWRTNALGEWYPSQIPHLMKLYDGEILWTDSQLGRLFQGLRERELTDDIIIILTADHGEEFLQHGARTHATNLYQHVLHVPLIIAGPGIQPGVNDSNVVGHIDILPTVLAFADISVPERSEGLKLFDDIPLDRPVYSSGVNCDSAQASVMVENYKVIWSPVVDSSEMYDLAVDPFERIPLETDSLLLEEVLRYWAWPCLWEPTDFELDLIEEKQLHDLGYI